MKAIVLLSGGLDSTLCLHYAVEMHQPAEVLALSLNYGQRHSRELKAAQDVARFYRVPHIVKELDSKIFTGAGSALTDLDTPMPEVTYAELSKMIGPSPTYVPFRNGNLLSVAAAMALSAGAEYIYYGAHSEDAKNWAYPDCTPEFNGAMANAIYVGTYHKVRLVTPLQWVTKADIAAQSCLRGTPIHLTWSCYKGGNLACGKCPTCIGRIEAFKIAGFKDRIVYEGEGIE